MAEPNKCTLIARYTCKDSGWNLGSLSCPYYKRNEKDVNDNECWNYNDYAKLCTNKEARIDALKKYLESINWTGEPKND